jgi:hypothetical protein
MENSISLYKIKSTQPYPIRVLKYDNTCIDENYEVTNSVIPASQSSSASFPISQDENTKFQTLIQSYNQYMSAKLAYERAADTFWKSEIGARCKSYLAPDPIKQDRGVLEAKIKELDRRLASQCIQIKYRNVEISGYNYIIIKYILIMYETQTPPPRFFNDFVRHTINEQVIKEIPKIWTNKVALECKKEVELVYISGNVLPPYRYTDMSETASAS